MRSAGQSVFWTQRADGSILFDFTGHVSALGLDLLSSTGAVPPADRKVRWLLQSDGSVMAELYTFGFNAADRAGKAALQSHVLLTPQAGALARSDLIALDDTSFQSAQIGAGYQPDGNLAYPGFPKAFIDGRVGNLNFRLLDEFGGSDFVYGGAPWTAWPGSAQVGAFGAPYENPQYRAMGRMVEFRGLLKALSPIGLGGSLGQLPVGARPVNDHLFIVDIGGAPTRLYVPSTGLITANAAIGTGTNIALDGVMFALN